MKEILNAIDNYMEKTIKKDYILSDEEYFVLLRKINILKNHLEMLASYETKRKDSNE